MVAFTPINERKQLRRTLGDVLYYFHATAGIDPTDNTVTWFKRPFHSTGLHGGQHFTKCSQCLRDAGGHLPLARNTSSRFCIAFLPLHVSTNSQFTLLRVQYACMPASLYPLWLKTLTASAESAAAVASEKWPFCRRHPGW